MTVASEEKLKLGKGAAFAKSRLKLLPQRDEIWEADFQELPTLIMQSEPHYLGQVVAQQDGSLLAQSDVHGRPSVNDLATLLAHAMERPLDEGPRRPKLIHLRGHPQWRELFSALEELKVEVSVKKKLPKIKESYKEFLRQFRKTRRAEMIHPTPKQAEIEKTFPAISRYVGGYGFIEIGDQESFGFVVRAMGYGGLDFEDDRPDTLAEALAVLEAGLARWFAEQGVEVE